MSADPLYAAVYRLAADTRAAAADAGLAALAQDFSPRFEVHRGDLVAIDVSGLGRLLGTPRAIGEELQRAAAQRGLRVQVALAGTRMAALILAQARAGLTIVPAGDQANALAPIPVGLLEKMDDEAQRPGSPPSTGDRKLSAISAFTRWGVKTLGALAAIPAADLSARVGQQGLRWHAMARGDDVRPLVPAIEAERFEASLDLEWPIEGLEPLSFVLTRLLEPLSTRLERRDRGAAVLHVVLRLVTREPLMRSLQIPAPLRDVRTLRTLALLDLESHPPPAAIDRVQIVIDPTPGRVLQHTLFTRAQPTPEQLSTLLARLTALLGADRIGAAAIVDSYRPGAFAMRTFEQRSAASGQLAAASQPPAARDERPVVTALRRCRHPVPARVAVAAGRPVRVTSDRRGFAGGAVVDCTGPWRTSGEWWAEAGGTGEAGGAWDRDEWDVALGDGAVYRIFQDRRTERWFFDAIVD